MRTNLVSGSRTWRSWQAARMRCQNPKDPSFYKYGARGITVCERWSSYAAFLEDMGERPPEKTLERIDNDGPYSPENCRWASRIEQANNCRRTRFLCLNGKTQSIQYWARETGIGPETLRWRLKRGWPVEKALTQKSRCA